MSPPDIDIASLDWTQIAAQLDEEGYAVLPRLLDADAARDLARRIGAMNAAPPVLRDCGDSGHCQLFYFTAGLPPPLHAWRAAFYPDLAAIANRWNEILGIGARYPAALGDFLRQSEAVEPHNRSRFSRLGVEGYMPLSRHDAGGDGDGAQVFPLKLVALLSEPGQDFHGGEFVMTEQRPRMQSRPAVVPLALGDAAIVATGFRPFMGVRGHYRVKLRHAISRVRRGERIGVDLTFHDAP